MIHAMVMMMKISKSKKELARIISENGGWRDGEFAAQDGDGLVGGYGSKPEWNSLSKYWWREAFGGWFLANKIKNHHQTVLSRTEYFHLYPAPGAKPEFCESVMRTIPELEVKPTIEQLAADYRNAKDCAERKQQEADAAKADADERLRVLEIAGEAHGLLVSPITAKQEPELAITDWLDLQTGDLVWVEEEGGRVAEGEYEVLEVEVPDYDGKRTIRIRGGEGGQFWINCENGWRFIRRP